MTAVRGLAGFLAAIAVAWGFTQDDPRWLMALGVATPLLIVALRLRLPANLPPSSHHLVRLGSLLLVAFVVLSLHLVRTQVVVAGTLANDVRETAQGDPIQNPRLVDRELTRERGRMLDRFDNEIVVTEQLPDGYGRRVYLNPSLANVTGYYAPLTAGKSGLEAAYDELLSGAASTDLVQVFNARILGRPVRGDDLHLTIDPELQRLAMQGLAGQRGAVVVLDPQSGAVLALATVPTFDPNRLAFDPAAASWGEESARGLAEMGKLRQNTNAPLLDRALQGLYPPGSTFKTLTLAAAIDSGLATPDTPMKDEGQLVVEGHVIPDPNRPQPVRDQYTLRESYAYSLNAVFADLGLRLGAERLQRYAAAFGFGRPIPFDLPTEISRLAAAPGFLNQATALADTAFGQGKLQVTPLQMALVAATVARGGEVPAPFVVERVTDPAGKLVRQTVPTTLGRAISQDTARAVRDIMVTSVDSGYARGARVPGVQVGGKTGTAETGQGPPHAWFIGFAPATDPRIAVAVVVENGGEGSATAVPLAQRILQRAVSR